MSMECEYKEKNKCRKGGCPGAFASAVQCLTAGCGCPRCPWRRCTEPVRPTWPEWPCWPWNWPPRPMPVWC